MARARWLSAAELDPEDLVFACCLLIPLSRASSCPSLRGVVGGTSYVYDMYQHKSSVILLAFLMCRKWLLQLQGSHAVQSTKEGKEQYYISLLPGN